MTHIAVAVACVRRLGALRTLERGTQRKPWHLLRRCWAHTRADDASALPSQAYMRLASAGDISMDRAQMAALGLFDRLHKEMRQFEPSPIDEYDEHVVHRYKKVRQHRIKEAIKQHEATQRELYGFSGEAKLKELSEELKVDTKLLEEDLSDVQLPHVKDAPQGVYLWGSVGCGKSMLMDLFYKTAPTEHKLRIHFHSFMRDTLQHLHRLSHLCNEKHREKYDHNLTHLVAKNIACQARLLCFDEMQIPDVGTAGILYRLLTHLKDYGVVVVATSNRPPADLYQGDFKETLFEPFVEVLETHCKVFHVESNMDYRTLMPDPQDQQGVFMDPVFVGEEDASKALRDAWSAVTADKRVRPASVHVLGRNVSIPESTPEGQAYFDFRYLCGSPLGPSDYLAIARQFHTVFLEGIPKMQMSSRNEARRFITLVDALYECKAKLFASVQLPIERLFVEVGDAEQDRFEIMHGEMLGEMMYDLGRDGTDVYQNVLFTGEEEVFASKRCISRLHEMRSPSYLSEPHQPGLGMVGIDAAFLDASGGDGDVAVTHRRHGRNSLSSASAETQERNTRRRPKFGDKHFFGFGWWESILSRRRNK